MKPAKYLCVGALLSVASLLVFGPSKAIAGCAAEPLLGSLCLIATNFCPRGYTPAEGQAFQIENNQALFALLGTTYGGDGRKTFNLPDLRASVPVGVGQRPGMKQVSQGAQGRLGPGRHRMAAATLGLRYCIAIQGIFPSRN